MITSVKSATLTVVREVAAARSETGGKDQLDVLIASKDAQGRDDDQTSFAARLAQMGWDRVDRLVKAESATERLATRRLIMR